MSTVTLPESEIKKTQYATYAEKPGVTHFWLRRLHSLLGLMFGGYVTVHLLVNATGWVPKVYQMNVDKIHDLEPMLPVIEIVAIFLPLLFHAIYGAYAAQAGVKFNTVAYPYGGNVRYFLQRITAWILLAFVAYHVLTLHKWGLGAFRPNNEAYQSTVEAMRSPYGFLVLNVGVMIFYLLGIWSATFHFANGLWTSAIAWGLTTTASSQRRWGHVCLMAGIVLTLAGTVAWAAFTVGGRADYPVEKTFTRTHAEAQETHGDKTGGGQEAARNLPAQPGTQPGK